MMGTTKNGLAILGEEDLSKVFGGDRWGDGMDHYNHPDPRIIAQACTPVDNPVNGSGWEICVMVRTR
jgi:hypothetical protein